MTARGQVVTAGTLWLGHPRRCPRLFLETPLYLGEGCRLEAGFVGMGTQVGNDTWVRRCRRIGRFPSSGNAAGSERPMGRIPESFPSVP